MNRREEKRRAMGRLVRRWKDSGMSCAEFARQEGIATSQLRYWAGVESQSAAMVPSFVPVQILPEESSAATACFELILGDGRTLVIPAELTGRALRELLLTLGSC